MGLFQWLSGKKKDSPRRELLPVPPNLFQTLGMALAERYKATLEHEARLEELALKRHELDVANAENLAKAAAVERESKAELRKQRKEWAREHQPAIQARRREAERCRVCSSPGNPSLTTAEILAHHNNGHPTQGVMVS